jgi:adenosylcobinamide-GDP ribazoletransferase
MDREKIDAELAKLAAALRFFTRLPLPGAFGQSVGDDGRLAAAVKHFPLAGAVVGALAALVLLAMTRSFPPAVAAGVALAFTVWLTGALHEDGLADAADGLGGVATRERALEIMRDSRIGVFGACALVFSLGFRWAALAAIAGNSVFAAAAALILAHAVSRGAIAPALAFSSYARVSGAASTVAAGISREELAATAAICAAIAFILAGLPGILATVAAFAAAGLVLARAHGRLGGYTGDILGAMQQAAEVAALCVLSIGAQS